MKIATSIWTGVALLAMAQAAPPKVSGKYALMIFTQCEARFTTTPTSFLKTISPADGTVGIHTHSTTAGPGVQTVNPFNSGELNIGVGTITFPATAASSGNASFEAFVVSGGSLRVNTTGGAMATHTEAAPGTFSFTNTLFTFDPADDVAMTWTFRAGNIVSGVARTLYMVRRQNARCVNAVTATKQ